VARAQHHPLAERGIRPDLPGRGGRDGPGQAGSALHPDERSRHQNVVVIPVLWRNGVSAVQSRLRGMELSGWTSPSGACPTGIARGRPP